MKGSSSSPDPAPVNNVIFPWPTQVNTNIWRDEYAFECRIVLQRKGLFLKIDGNRLVGKLCRLNAVTGYSQPGAVKSSNIQEQPLHMQPFCIEITTQPNAVQ